MNDGSGGNGDVNRGRLFLGSCVALIATSVAFVTVAAIMFTLKGEFVLTNADVGWIAGAGLWGFAVSQVVSRRSATPSGCARWCGWPSSATSAVR